jgi:hypothetical protein
MTMTTTITQVHAMDIVSVQLAVADKFNKQGKCPIIAVVSHLSKGTVTSLEKPHILMGRARQRAEKKQVCVSMCMCMYVCVCVCVLTPVSPSCAHTFTSLTPRMHYQLNLSLKPFEKNPSSLHLFVSHRFIDIITAAFHIKIPIGDAEPAGDRGEEETGGDPAKDTRGARLSQRLFFYAAATFSCRHHSGR